MITQGEAREYADMLLKHFLPKLTEWEDGFVRSVHAQMQLGRQLSEKQLSSLDRIMERCSAQHGRF